MPDISMCMNKECPKKNKCYRYMAVPNPFRQSYADFGKELPCDHYWPLANATGETRGE